VIAAVAGAPQVRMAIFLSVGVPLFEGFDGSVESVGEDDEGDTPHDGVVEDEVDVDSNILSMSGRV